MVGLSHLQVRLRSRQVAITQVIRLLLLITLNITLLRLFHLGLSGALAGNIAGSVLSGSFTAIMLLRSAGFRISINLPA